MGQSREVHRQSRLRTLPRRAGNAVRQVIGKLDEKHWRAIQYLFVAPAVVLAVVTLHANWASLSSFDWDLDLPLFGLSALLVSAAILSLAVWWTLSVRLLQGLLGWKQGVRIWAVAQLAKYLPGGVWNYAARAYASDRAGVPGSCTALSLAVETVLRVQAALAVFLVSLPFWPDTEWSHLAPIGAAGMLLAGLLVLSPRIVGRAIGLVQRILGRPPVETALIKYRHTLVLLAAHVLTVAGSGAAFYLMVVSVHPVPASAGLPMAGMLAFSVIAGFLNPLTPHGLGTREGLLIVLLNYYVPLPVAVVISLLARFWMTASEVIGISVVAVLFRK